MEIAVLQNTKDWLLCSVRKESVLRLRKSFLCSVYLSCKWNTFLLSLGRVIKTVKHVASLATAFKKFKTMFTEVRERFSKGIYSLRFPRNTITINKIKKKSHQYHIFCVWTLIASQWRNGGSYLFHWIFNI